MHVLLLALNYWPDQLGNAPLMVGMCEGLVRRGHRVSVVCAFPHHESGRIEGPYRGKLFQRDRHNGVEILRTYIYAGEHGTVAKMANYASFTATGLAAAAALSVRERIDVVFTPSPPLTLGLIDHALSVTRGIPFVYNLQDLFPEAAIRLGVLQNPRIIEGFRHLERFVYEKADRLSVISEGFREYLRAFGVPDEKIAVIPNYTDTELIVPEPSAETRYRTELQLGGKFVVQFSGRMGYSQSLDTVADAWERLTGPTGRDDLHLMLVGDGQARGLLEERLGGRADVTLLPTQPRERLSSLLATADVSLAPLRHGMAGTSVPSKIFGIMASARPVIAAVDPGSDTDQLLQTADCGLVVTPEDPDALAGAIASLHADRARARALGENGRRHVVAHHGREAIVDQYERLLLDVVARSR
ncbi:MAG: glycosyltransferase family 4 protein [Bradymonadia bacterium]|jgi:colanic acid biosynthesis glycosyl transferase WcaI